MTIMGHGPSAGPSLPRRVPVSDLPLTTEAQPPFPAVARTTSARRAWRRRYVSRLLALDISAAIVGAVSGLVAGARGRHADLSLESLTAVAVPVVWGLLLWSARAYETRFLEVGTDEYRRVWNAGLRLLALLSIADLALRLSLGRAVVATVLPVTVALTLAGRWASRTRLHRRQQRGVDAHRVVVLGRSTSVGEFAERLLAHPGYELVAVCTEAGGPVTVAGVELPRAGGAADVVAAVKSFNADTVAVAGDTGLFRQDVRRLGWQLEGSDVDLVFCTDLVEVAGPRVHMRPIDGMPLIHVEEPELRGARQLLKTTYDRVLAGVALVLLTPLILVVTVVVRLDSRGPSFFSQTRVGRDGREFKLWKFRSMVVDAEAELKRLRELNEQDGLLFKMRADPRVTRAGRFLRATSVDELPQLVNVLLGHMSLVGPRPPLPSEVAAYDGRVQRRLLVRPGLTGLWQVSGRSSLTWEQSVRLDLSYVENWTPLLDLSILLRTVKAVFARSGAY